MKNTVKIILVLLMSFLLTSCFNSNNNINKAKKEMWIVNEGVTWISDSKIEKSKESILEEKIIEKEVSKVEITPLTKEQFLEIDSLEWEDLLDGKVEITWKTLANVDKIIVNFANESSVFPIDKYTLKQFEAGGKTFLYRAFTKYETLDFWKNIYVLEAYSWDKVAKLQLVLNVIKDEPKVETVKKEKVYQDLSVDTLPSNDMFWIAKDNWNWIISYSNIKWLEIRKEIISNLACDTVTSSLADSIDGWFFWNTCRPIETDEWIAFFVIRLDWEEYVYEKHYYLSYQGIYAVLELKRWTWVTNQNISEKNTALKGTNDSYSLIWITNDLFKQILK
jgi:hypothetical protein